MADLEQLAAAFAKAAAEELADLLRGEVELEGPSVSTGSRDELVKGASGTLTPCTPEEDSASPLYLVTALASAKALAAAHSEEAAAEEGDALGPESLHACGEVLEAVAGVLVRVIGETEGLPGFSGAETVALETPLRDDALLPAGSYRRARLTLQLAGNAAGTLDLLIPGEQAAAWFGADAESEAGSGQPVALLDPSEADRSQFEEMAEALGRPAWVIDPVEIGPELADELADSSAVVIAWNLGGRSGLDVLETLRRDERTRHLQVAMSAEAPTRDMVNAALRWGARTFLHKPYDADEIRGRLLSS